jgi:hypothetical protein
MGEEQKQDVIDVDPQPLATIQPGGGLTAQRLSDVEHQIEVLNRIRHAVIACTSEEQWVDFGGRPYLEGDGALTVASLFGLSIEETEFVWHDLPGGGRQVEAIVRVELGGRTFSDHGDCDSYDDFLVTRRAGLIQSGASPAAAEAILGTEMKKKARANALSRVVSGWAGIRGLGWEDLEALGLIREKAGSVKFRKGKRAKTVAATSIAEARSQQKGSVVAFGGKITDAKSGTTKKQTPYCDIGIHDGTGGVYVRMWKALPDWAVNGAVAFFPSVTIEEYQGKPQYKAEAVEQGDGASEGESSNANPASNAGNGSGSDQSQTPEHAQDDGRPATDTAGPGRSDQPEHRPDGSGRFQPGSTEGEPGRSDVIPY